MFQDSPPSTSLADTRMLRGGSNVPESRTADSVEHLNSADLRSADLSGRSLGQYDLGARLGRGGMGTVYAARHRVLQKVFAIKFLHGLAGIGTEEDQRFEQEVLALGKLQHPNIVTAVDAGRAGELRYLVTELVDGVNLQDLVAARGPLPVRLACHYVRQAALGIAHSHAAGCLHRDIKPSNLTVDKQGVVKLLDFGLARHLSSPQQLTQAGSSMGTCDYMPPEQAHDASSVDQRGDVYSLGCTLLFLLSGEPPFAAPKYATAAAKLKGHLFDTPPWLQHPTCQIPAELMQLLREMMAKNPGQRHRSAAQVTECLLPWCDATSEPRDALLSLRGIGSGFSLRPQHLRLLTAAVTTVCVPLCWISVGRYGQTVSGRATLGATDNQAIEASSGAATAQAGSSALVDAPSEESQVKPAPDTQAESTAQADALPLAPGTTQSTAGPSLEPGGRKRGEASLSTPITRSPRAAEAARPLRLTPDPNR